MKRVSAIRSSALAALTVLPGMALAHHGEDDSIGGQLVHVTFDPWHLGITLAVVAVLAGAWHIARRRGQGS